MLCGSLPRRKRVPGQRKRLPTESTRRSYNGNNGNGNTNNTGGSQNQSGILFPIDGEVSELEEELIGMIRTTSWWNTSTT